MSLIKIIDLEIKNIDALAKACTDKDLLFMRGVDAYKRYGSRTSPCDHVIRVPQDTFHEIGVIRVGEGVHKLAYDGDSYAINEVMDGLTQQYQYHAAVDALPYGCYVESVETDAEGNLLVWAGEN